MESVLQPTSIHSKQEIACIGKGVVIRGELNAEEDLIIEGQVEGKIALNDHRVVIGKHGVIQGEIRGRNVTVNAKVVGNIYARELTEITATGYVEGKIKSRRIKVADGAYFTGSVDLSGERPKKNLSHPEPAKVTFPQLQPAEVQPVSV